MEVMVTLVDARVQVIESHWRRWLSIIEAVLDAQLLQSSHRWIELPFWTVLTRRILIALTRVLGCLRVSRVN